MASIIDNSQIYVTLDKFREGKITALQILYETYLDIETKGVKALSIEELLQTIRTLILNLEKQGGTSS